MLTKTDHPLSDRGITQCEELRARLKASETDKAASSAERRFMDAQLVYCSPLTRAVQTALICTSALLGAQNIPLHLMPSAREIKKFGGRDSHGHYGPELLPRVTEKLAEYYGDARAQALVFDVHWVMDDVYDDKWWNSILETQGQVEDRAACFLEQLRLAPDGSIVVGHSLFFQQIFKLYLNNDCNHDTPEMRHNCTPEGLTLYEGLTKRKLSNCGVAECWVDFGVQGGASIRQVQLIFETHLE